MREKTLSLRTYFFVSPRKGNRNIKIAVSSTGEDLEATLDARFGRAAYFVIVDPDTLAYEAVVNRQNLNLPQGAGLQDAKTVLQHKADALI